MNQALFEDQMMLFQSQIIFMPLAEIKINPNQPRKYFNLGKLEDLSSSIRKHGIIQPLVVRQEGSKTLLVAGERRLRAADMAGLKEVPVFYIQGDPLEISLIENIQREDLNAIEEAEAVQHIQDVRGYKQEQLATILGKAQNTVSEILALMRLPKKIRDACRKDVRWSRSQLLKIARLKSEEEMLEVFEATLKKMNQDDRKQLNEPPTNKPTQNANAAIKRMSQLEKNFKSLDFSKIRSDQKIEIKDKLETLRKQINVLLKAFE